MSGCNQAGVYQTETPVKACIVCPESSCYECNDESNRNICTKCQEDYFFQDLPDSRRVCTPSCPLAQGARVDGNGDLVCTPCPENCLVCTFSSSTAKCLKCQTGLLEIMKEGKSVCIPNSECPTDNGYYINFQKKVCLPCPFAGCKLCSEFRCEECQDPNQVVTQENVCVDECPPGYNNFDGSKICEPCSIPQCKISNLFQKVGHAQSKRVPVRAA